MHILRELWTKDIDEDDTKCSYQYVFELRERLEETMKIAQEELEKSQGRYKHHYDKKARPRSLNVGDKVLILLPTDNNKLLMQWKGPFDVDKIVAKNDYGINVNGKVKTYHINLLKQYILRDKSSDSEDTVVSATDVFELTSATVINDCGEDDEELLEMSPCGSKENYHGVTLGKQLNTDEQQVISDMLRDFSDIFTDIPGKTSIVQHKVDLTTPHPVRSRPYQVPHSVRDSLRQDIKYMLEMGIIRESTSPYASPVVIVKKPDGSNRVCIDFRKLNKISVFDPEPMVTAEDLFAKMNKSKYFTKIDFTKGYWQIPVAPEDIPKTGFVTPDGCYEFIMMPYGMVNAGATYVKGMRKLLHGMDHVESYIDDILVHTATWEEHLATLRELFCRIRSANLTVRPSKCTVASDNVEFIGHDLHEGIIGLQEKNIEKIRDAPQPVTKKEVRSFIGLTGFYRSYIPNYSTIAVPLTDLTKKGQPNKVIWGEAQERAYRTLKNKLVNKPILRMCDLEKSFTLRTDASDTGLGAMILQQHDDGLFPVSFASRKLLDREKRYSVLERECLAVVWGIKKFKMYLYGVEFILQTDHQSLVYLDRAKFENDRVMRWAMFLQNYRFRIEAIKGSANVGADYLSRVLE